MNDRMSLSTSHYRWLAGLWTLGIVVACSLPPASFSGVQPGLGVDKVVHFGLFAGFGALWMRALCPPGGSAREKNRRRVVGLLVVGGVFAVGAELYQHVLPIRRMADPYDAIANGGGLLAGILVYEGRRWAGRLGASAR